MKELQKTFTQIGKATFLILLLSLLAKLIAIIKEAVIAAKFGTSPELDAFNIAYAYPAIVILFLSGAMTSAFVPLFIEWQQISLHYAFANSRRIFYWNLLIFALITIFSYIFSSSIYGFVGFGFDDSRAKLTVSISIILLSIIFIDGIAIIPQAILQSQKRFFTLNVSTNFPNLAIIVFALIFYNKMGVFSIAWGTVVGTGAKLIYTLLSTIKKSEGCVQEHIQTPLATKSYYILLLPLLGSEMIANMNIFVDQVMATKLGQGAVSTLRYAYRINDVPVQLIIISLTQAILPFISKQALSEDKTELEETFKIAAVFVAFLSLPITMLVLLYSVEIVTYLFQRGAFDSVSTSNTAGVLVFYSLGLIFYAYSFVNGNFFVALRQGRLLFLVGIISVILNFTFNLIFMHLWGVRGIALSTSVTLMIVSIIFLLLLTRKLQFNVFPTLIKNIAIILGCCLAMYLAGMTFKSFHPYHGLSKQTYTLFSILLLCSIYVVLVYLFRSKELITCLNITKSVLIKFKERGHEVS